MGNAEDKAFWNAFDRIMRLSFPFIIMWSVWVTTQIFNQPHEQKEWVRANYPSKEMQQKMDAVQLAVQKMQVELAGLNAKLGILTKGKNYE